MRALLVTLVVLLAFPAVPALAQTPVERTIRSVILDQMTAFQENDGPAAFAIASPGIQAKFRDPKTFMHMVATAYPQVYRPKKIVFLDLVRTTGRTIQQVVLHGPEGEFVTALYFMVLIDGRWRIDGCKLVQPETRT